MSKFTNKLNVLSQKIIATPVASPFFCLTMIVIFIMTSSFNTVAEEGTIPSITNYYTEVGLYDVDNLVDIIDSNNTKSIHTLYTLPSACVPPSKDPRTVAPSSYDIDVVASGTITWSSLVGVDPEKITNKIRITGNGTVMVSNANLKLEGNDAAVVIDGPTLLIDNGNIQIESSGAKFIMNNGVLRTYGNVQQKPNSILCIQDSEVEIGDESANGVFTTSGSSSTSADFQNDGGYRYLNNVCINITHDYQLQSTGSGTDLNGVDVLINVCMEVGDRGPNHATPTDFGVSDNDDSGNFQNSNRMFIYDTTIIIANGDFQNNSGTITFCNLETKLNKSGNFQNNSGTFRGEALCIAAEDVIENSGNWDVTISSWYSDKQNTLINIPNGGPESTKESILNSCFTACCMSEECELQIELDDVIICSGESVELNPTLSGVSECGGSGSGISYLWSTGETTPSITVSPKDTTTYEVTVKDCEDCEATDVVIVNVTTIEGSAGDDQTICTEGESINLVDTSNKKEITLTAQGGDSYLWSTGETTQSIKVLPEKTTEYTVIITKNDCSIEDSVTVFVENCEGPTVTRVTVYPTMIDANKDLSIKFMSKVDQNIMISLHGLSGANVGKTLNSKVTKGENTIKYGMNTLSETSEGIYLLRIVENGESIMKKIVIKR